MADTITVHFHGGPCDLTSRVITRDQFAVGALTCKGVTYVYAPGSLVGGLASYIPAQTAAQEAAATRAVGATHVAGAWGRLTRALAVTAPRQIRRQHRATARLRRIGR